MTGMSYSIHPDGHTHKSTPQRSPGGTILARRSADSPKTLRTFSLSSPTYNVQDHNSPRRSGAISTRGFSPLPVIIASPVCTPTTNVNMYTTPFHLIYEPQELLYASTTRSAMSTPTWISIPPTPPPRLSRHSAMTLQPPRPSSAHISPSASFPALSPTHGTLLQIRRRASLPELASQRSLPSSETPSQFTSRNSSATALQSSSPSGNPRSLLFHIEHGSSEDETPQMVDSPNASSESLHLNEQWSRNKHKDNIRKFHALMELLSTEVGYLADLRALVTIYLRNLPTLLSSRSPSSAPSSFSRNPSAFNLSSRSNSLAHLQFTSLTQLPTDIPPPKENKATPRYVFTDVEVETLTRNAEEVLELHEHFVQELTAVVKPLGLSMTLEEDIDEDTHSEQIAALDQAVGAVSTKFATEASRFNSYQSFCAGHPQALILIRKAQQQHSVAWEAFERRCADLVSDMAEVAPSAEFSEPSSPKMRRNHSLSSFDGHLPSFRPRTNTGPAPVSTQLQTKGIKYTRRLTCMDYMIKPVQRICKYPLLLDQLKTSRTLTSDPGTNAGLSSPSTRSPRLRSDVQVIVESATQAMRHVAVSVDEARHRQDIEIQSSLILSRILHATPSPNVPHVASIHPPFHVLSPSFLSSLGSCLLAGSLDVMHHPLASYVPINTANIKAKYLGAFLYLGGYLLLVKVSKGKYEPKHWFSLVGFEVVDVQGEDAMLPCSLRLTGKGHQFELAAACQREKEAWISAIRESLTQVPAWTNEPTSSLQMGSKGELVPSTLGEDSFVSVGPLPSMQSIPDVHIRRGEHSAVAVRDSKHGKPVSKQDGLVKPEAASRKSSTASVKGMFHPIDSETILIRRSSPNARAQVDSGLQDVISQLCLTARSHANSKEEELFKAPSVTRSGFPRSNSGLSMAKNRLSKHESLRVPRRKSLLETTDLPSRRQTSSMKSPVRGRKLKTLSIASASDGEHSVETLFPPTSESSSDSPDPLSQCSSVGSSDPASIMSSPAMKALQANASSAQSPLVLESRQPSSMDGDSTITKINKARRRRSVVDNVRYMFQSRSTSPHPLPPIPPIPPSKRENEQKSPIKTPSPGLLKRWAQGTLHRRARSAPMEEESSIVPHVSPVLPELDFGADISYRTSTDSRLAISRSFFQRPRTSTLAHVQQT